MIYTYIGMHLCLYLGNVENSEIGPIPPNNSYLQPELKHIQNVLNIYNDFPMWIIKQIMKEVKERQKTLVTTHIGTPL